MAMERVPYLVGGGFEHSAEVIRAALAASTSGAEGIVSPGDFKVSELPVPGTSVVAAPGNGLIRNSYGSGFAQTYACRAGSQTELPVMATGSASGRTDLVVARIDDPTYMGGAFDPGTFEAARFEIIRGVPAGTRTAAELGLAYPAIELARIDMPASTGTVTDGMITDLRRLALPRRDRNLLTIYGSGSRAEGTSHLVVDGYTTWPIRESQRPTVWVPEWATQLQMNVTIAGAYYIEKNPPESVYGFRTGFASEALGQNGMLTIDTRERVYMNVVGTHPVPEALRGTEQQLDVLATRTRGIGDLGSDYQCSITIDYEFSQVAD